MKMFLWFMLAVTLFLVSGCVRKVVYVIPMQDPYQISAQNQLMLQQQQYMKAEIGQALTEAANEGYKNGFKAGQAKQEKPSLR